MPVYLWLFAYCPAPLLWVLRLLPRRWRAQQVERFLRHVR